MLRQFSISVAIALIAGAVNAEDWLVIPTNSANVEFSIDTASIQHEGSRVKFSERLVYRKPEQKDALSGKFIKEKLVYRVMDCGKQTQGVLRGSLRAVDGRIIESISVDEAKVGMTPVPPGTLAAKELEIVCEPAVKGTPTP